MGYAILAIVTAILGFFGWAWSLVRKNQTLKDLLASKDIQDELSKITTQITAEAGKVSQDETDYSNAKSKFNSDTSDTSN